MVQEFSVLDITCGRCAAAIKRAVSRVDGVSAVEADVARKRVRVAAAEDVSRTTIVTAITKAGYTQIAPAMNQAPTIERWTATALELTPSFPTTSSGCGC